MPRRRVKPSERPTPDQVRQLQAWGIVVPPTRTAAASLIQYVLDHDAPTDHPRAIDVRQSLRRMQRQLLGRTVWVWMLPNNRSARLKGRIEYLFARSQKQHEAWRQKGNQPYETLMCVIRCQDGGSIVVGTEALDFYNCLVSPRQRRQDEHPGEPPEQPNRNPNQEEPDDSA